MAQQLDNLLPQWGWDKVWKSRKRGKRINQRTWGWISTWVTQFDDGSEERGISIRLPIFGHAYSINTDDVCMAQSVLYYLGQRGFVLGVYFPPENKNG